MRTEHLGGELDPTGRGVELAVAERSTVVGIRGAHPTDRAQFVEVDRRERLAQQGLVVVEQGRFGVAHRRGEPAEQIGVGDDSPTGAIAAPFHPTQR